MLPSWMQVTKSLLGHIKCNLQMSKLRKVLGLIVVNSPVVALFSLQNALSLLLDIPCLTWLLSLAVPTAFVSSLFFPRMKGFGRPDLTQMRSVLLLWELFKTFLVLEIAGRRDRDRRGVKQKEDIFTMCKVSCMTWEMCVWLRQWGKGTVFQDLVRDSP